MKIALITDAWGPKQVNGVVTTLTNLVGQLEKEGHDILVINPNDFKTIPLPFYPEIELAINPWRAITLLKEFKPEYIHIATEGPLGLTVAKYCRRNKIKYTSSYHTEWVSFVKSFLPIVPKFIIQNIVGVIHKYSSSILVTNNEMKASLEKIGYKNLIVWTRGVDRDIFNPSRRKLLFSSNPIYLNVGRISPEKNLPDFFNMEIPGKKVVVGDGPLLETYKLIYPEVEFVGIKHGVELAEYFASADVFVFPSKSDTFGVVMLEALASGIPVAAYPVTGPNEIVENGVNGFLSNDLSEAATKCLTLNSKKCLESSEKWTWENTAKIFKDNLVNINVY